MKKNYSNQEQKIATSFSVTSLNTTFSRFNTGKKELVQGIGFHIILKLMPQSKFPRQVALWVIRNLKCTNGEITVGERGQIRANESDVELVLGIPRKTNIVKCGCDLSELDICRMRKVMLLNNDEEITVECVEVILTRDYGSKMSIREREAFKVAFVLYVDAYFLGPQGAKAKINQDMFTNLTNSDSIAEMNWCGYVLNCLIQSSMRVKQSFKARNKTVTLEGCLLFAVVC